MKDVNRENQISSMLGQVFDEKGNGNLIFSDIEDNEDDLSTQLNDCGQFPPMKSPSVQSLQDMMDRSSMNKYQRLNKKFGTISFNNINMPLMSHPPMHLHLHPQHQQQQQQHLPNQMYPFPYTPSSYCHSPHYPLQYNPQMFQPQQQQQYSLHQMPPNPYHSNANSQYANLHQNLSNQRNQFQRSNIRKKTFDNNKGMLQFKQCIPINSLSINNNNNCEVITEEKPQKQPMINPKIEMLLNELTINLAKIEKVDHYIFNRLQGFFIPLIKTHRGSRIFQNYLKNTHSEIIHQIFLEINPLLADIMHDSYANYFCKRFFTFLNQKDRIDFLLSIQETLYQLSIDTIGTYPIQSIVEQVGSKVEKKIIINAIKDKFEELCFDTYGSYVLKKIISCFEEELISFIYDYVSNNFLLLATHTYSIRVIKKILRLTHKKDLHEKLKCILLTKENAYDLIQHPSGYQVIQTIVKCWDVSEIKEIAQQFEGKYTELSMLRYSSTVVERCLEKSNEILEVFIKEMCNSGKIAEVMKNQFGNYVIQKGMNIVNDAKLKEMFIESIVKNIIRLNDKKIISKWKMLVGQHVDKENVQLQSVLFNSDHIKLNDVESN